MEETLRKAGLYLRGTSAYWQLVENNSATKIAASPIGRYPLDVKPRLASGHFGKAFDSSGLPLKPAQDGSGLVHNYTTLCAFALGHWDYYLLTGHACHVDNLLRVAEYILNSGETEGRSMRLRTELPGQGHKGRLSSMFQGQAISVLSRAWIATSKQRYLDAAIDCLGPFNVSVENDGVLARLTAAGVPWFEEWPNTRMNHALAGMVFSLWGLRDLANAIGHPRAAELLHIGVESVSQAICCFDTGFWSSYALPEDGSRYIASMMYHGLHICQLRALSEQFDTPRLNDYAARFSHYAGNPLCRFRAAASLFRAKFN